MLTPSESRAEVFDVTHSLELVRRNAGLSPLEFKVLAYLVEETLAGRGDRIHQKTIAADVFGRDLPTFNPRSDSTVRTTILNLRASLISYYGTRGQEDPVHFELTPGTYVPAFTPRAPLSSQAMRHLWSARATMEARTVSGYGTAIRHLDAVITEAPAYSLALALRAEALASQAIHGFPPRPNLEAARVFADRALSAPQPVWRAWLAQGIVRQALDWDWAGAGESYRTAVEMSSGEACLQVWYNSYLVAQGRPREGAVHLQRAVDHFGYGNATCMGDLSLMLIASRDYPAAQATIETALEAAPGYYQHHLHHAILLEAVGDAAGALRVLDQTPLHVMERPVTWGLRALFAGLSGAPGVARRRMAWMRTIAKTGLYIPQSQIAACQIGLGNYDDAVSSFEKAAEEREPVTAWLWAYPMLRHLRGHAGFERLADRIGIVRF